VGVAAALAAAADPGEVPRVKLWDEFGLGGRVAMVSGANRGLGLEMALALAEAGARAVYCVDLAEEPSREWRAVQEYVERIGTGGRMEYMAADVTDQVRIWEIGQRIGDKEGRMDVCVAAAGILKTYTDSLECPEAQFRKVRETPRAELARLMCRTGDGRQHGRDDVHCAGGGAPDGAVWECREHHPSSIFGRERRKQGKTRAVRLPSGLNRPISNDGVRSGRKLRERIHHSSC